MNDSTQSQQPIIRKHPIVLLGIGVILTAGSKWFLDALLASPVSGWMYQGALGVGILFGIQGLAAMTTAVAFKYEEVR